MTVTVDPSGADFTGNTHRVIQSAIEMVARFGGGTVRMRPGVYELGNAIHLRSQVNLVGTGDDTVLFKKPLFTTKLIEDADWYVRQVAVADPSGFETGGGLLLRSCEEKTTKEQFSRHTILRIEENRLHLDSIPRHNHWIDWEAAAVTFFPVVAGQGVRDVLIENLTLNGNRSQNGWLSGDHGGCVFLQECERIHLRGLRVADFEGDGISWQICHDVVVEDCKIVNHRDLGLHPGSGSQRPVIRNNEIANCADGLFWCWGVKHGVAEGNVIRKSSRHGISIGHRDTDNVIRRNQVIDSGEKGIFFRPERSAEKTAHRNRIEDNVVENAGSEKIPGTGIYLSRGVEDAVLRRNRVIDRAGFMSAGVHIESGVARLTMEGNVFEGVKNEIEDLRSPRTMSVETKGGIV